MRLSSFQAVAKGFGPAEHGLRSTDYQANRNRQSVPILEHLTADVRQAMPLSCCLGDSIYIIGWCVSFVDGTELHDPGGRCRATYRDVGIRHPDFNVPTCVLGLG